MVLGWLLLLAAFITGIIGLVLHGRVKWPALTGLILSVVGAVVSMVVLVVTIGGTVDDTQDVEDASALATPAEAPQSETSTTSQPTPQSTDTAVSTDPSAQVIPQPFNASGTLAGTASPSFPDGDPGEMSVVQVGPLDTLSGTLLFAFRNNTTEAVSHVDWSATAKASGSLVGSGASQGTIPAQIQPGEVGLAYIFFDNADAFPEGVEYEFAAQTTPADQSFYNTADLTVTEANLVGGSIVGTAANKTGASIAGPFGGQIYCFDGDDLVSTTWTYANETGPLGDGETVNFSNDLYGTSCDSFIVGMTGYFE